MRAKVKTFEFSSCLWAFKGLRFPKDMIEETANCENNSCTRLLARIVVGIASVPPRHLGHKQLQAALKTA